MKAELHCGYARSAKCGIDEQSNKKLGNKHQQFVKFNVFL